MRHFPLGDVLSVATGRVLSPRYVPGFRAIVAYMWQQSCDDAVAFLAMYPECKLWILEQHPQFKNEEFEDHLAVLDRKMGEATDPDDYEKIVFGWVENLMLQYGAELPVEVIPSAHRPSIDLSKEAALLMGPDRSIVL